MILIMRLLAAVLVVVFTGVIVTAIVRPRRRRCVLTILATEGPYTGRQLELRGVGRSVYVWLADLEGDGLIERRANLTSADLAARGFLPQHVYAITDAGRALL